MSPSKRMRVLIADDEDHVRQLLKGVLQSMACDVVGEAANGREAVASYTELHPDVVLLDINMPIMTGVEALKVIRNDSDEVIVVMLTSMADMATVEECIKAGASHYLRKDTPLAEIEKVLKKSWEQASKEVGEQ